MGVSLFMGVLGRISAKPPSSFFPSCAFAVTPLSAAAPTAITDPAINALRPFSSSLPAISLFFQANLYFIAPVLQFSRQSKQSTHLE